MCTQNLCSSLDVLKVDEVACSTLVCHCLAHAAEDKAPEHEVPDLMRSQIWVVPLQHRHSALAGPASSFMPRQAQKRRAARLPVRRGASAPLTTHRSHVVARKIEIPQVRS